MFKEVPSKFDFPKVEKEILAFWEENEIYEKSLEQSRGGKPFVFFEGPPTANGLPHPGHCLTRAIKDLFPRYKTMTGHYCLRKGGWDTHGLPVEVEVCKELGIHSKEEIEAYGVEPFNRKCLESVFRYTREWEDVTRRIGFWINLDEAYVTYHQSYVESVWWALKTLFDAGLLYQGHKIVWWWAQGGTALSAGEVGQGYREVDDPSVFVRFPIVMDDNAKALGFEEEPRASARAASQTGPNAASQTSLLVWTTTPWTLPSNMFAAVHADFDYALVHDKVDGERLIFAKELVGPIAKKLKATERWTIERTFKGAELVGLRYRPPFDCYAKRPAKDFVPRADETPLNDYQAALTDGNLQHAFWRVLHAGFVTLDAGTGLVHQAPAFGEVDFDLFQEDRKRFEDPESVPLLCAVAPNGTFNDDCPEYKGRWVKDCDKDICQDMKERGVLILQEQYRHDYPFCWRAEDDPLIQYPRKSWFIRTTQFKEDMLANNQQINWLPEHIKAGRFGKFLESNVDWSLSRERYWGTPLPIWICQNDACGHKEAIDSYKGLLAKPGVAGLDVWEAAKRQSPDLSEHLKVHKPYVDAITYQCPKCGEGRMQRVPEVIDCWFDSGAMPFAQWGYPHENAEMFNGQFPADFISEALDQTRGWFYSLTAISVMLFGRNGVARPAGSVGLRPASQGSVGLRPASQGHSPWDGMGVSPVTPPGAHHGVLREPVTRDLAQRKRILPHWEAGGSTYFLTLRLQKGDLSEAERDIVSGACRHWDPVRMHLHALVVMPDHVHMLCTPLEKRQGEWWSVADLMHSIKGFSAQAINKRRGVSGQVWQQEYYDRIIRTASDFNEKWRYIVTNPARRGLPEDYPWVWVEPNHGPEAQAPHHGPEAHATHYDYPMPFRNCIVLGLLMGEDGQKMSKQKQNYKEPQYIFDHEGADAMRWLFFSGQTPWTSIRFQESTIAEGQREFLIRLYNCYSFFCIYANIDKWTPDQQPAADARIELDRWILSELNHCCADVYQHMEVYDNYGAAKALIEFVDALSNWYVRRNRERFWKSGMDHDKKAAYATLYDCLVTVSKLIAPFTPFLAESMYQNLVRLHDSEAPLSVHLCDYPIGNTNYSQIKAQIDQTTNYMMKLLRQVVSCGRAARAAAKIRVRQPLQSVTIFHRDADILTLPSYRWITGEELNVKRVVRASRPDIDEYVYYEVKPDFKKIGPKHGPLAPKIKAALAKHTDIEGLVKSLEQDGTCAIDVEGRSIELTTDEVAVELHAREGYTAERIPGCGILVLDTHITDELHDEGNARDLIHHIQQARKKLDLRYEQRIDLAIVGNDDVQRVVGSFGTYIMGETLAQTILNQPIPHAEPVKAMIEDYEVEIYVKPL